MTAWIAYTDPLCVTIDQAIAGHNFLDNRTIWHGVSELSLGTGGFTGSQWYQDNGPKGMEDARLEPRAFCTKGNVTFTFSGRALLIRINVAWSWFTDATVTINGVAPSTLGLLTAIDTLSCDAATYQLTADDYIDVVVADGLIDGSHTCIITIDSSDPAKFFSIAGFKIGTFTSQPIARQQGWLVPINVLLHQDMVAITISNRSNATIINPAFSFPAGLVDDVGAPLVTLNAAQLAPSESLSQTILPVFTGDEISGVFPFTLNLSAEYVDPAGSNTHTVTVDVEAGNTALNVVDTWFSDTLTGTGQIRIYTNIYGPYVNFTFIGDSLTLTTQIDGGRGILGIYASDNTTLLNSVDCNAVFPAVPASLQVSVLTGFGNGSHTVYLRKTIDDGLYVVFVAVSWSLTQQYSTIAEDVVLNYSAQQPVAMSAQSVSVNTHDVTFDPPILDAIDYSGTPVRQNTNLAYTEIMTRFPTFAVYYKTGLRDLLSQYDRLIVDPLAARTADVIHWQSMGIEVYGYIASGEEVGFYTDRYDFASALAPNRGDGTGPGGFASYYMYTHNPVTGPPDKDGVWASYYCNPDPAFGWPTRVEDYYAPQVLGGPLIITDEVVTTASATIARGLVIVFDTMHSPLDADETITLKTLDGVTTYQTYRDYTFDVKTGAFVLAETILPAVTVGQQLKISYTRKGHRMNGVFWDVVDTPDVYASDAFGFQYVAGYAEKFATFINDFSIAHPDAKIISNRGFTILPDIIQSCDGVMFETWLTTPTDINNLVTTDYVIITDPATIAYNDTQNTLLHTLRQTNTFDVYSLNYTHYDSRGDALRAYCRAEDSKKGYLSWQSTITLDQPLPNIIIGTPGLPITTNAFSRIVTKPI